MKFIEENGKVADDANRDALRLRDYITGLEQINRMMEQEIASGRIEVDSLLENMLPFLREVFNSESSFVADEKGIIILSTPRKTDLLKECIPDAVKATPNILKGEPLVITDTITSFSELKKLDINSILILKSQIHEKWRWIGICNGENKPEPYIGGDKKFLKELIRLFIIGIDYGYQRELIRRYTEKETEYKIFSERLQEAQYEGDWSVIWQAAEDFLYVHPELNNYFEFPDNQQILNKFIDTKLNGDEVSSIFLDAWLCDFILKFSSNHSSETQPAKKAIRKIFKVNARNETYDINLPKRKIKLKNIPIEKYKRAALAGVRIHLTDFHFVGVLKRGKSTLSKASPGKKETPPATSGTSKTDKSLLKSIERTIELTEPEIDINLDKDDSFELLVDWLRTQWLHIFGLARQCSVEPVPVNVEKMQGIYAKVLPKTVELIQSYLSSGSKELEHRTEEKETAVDDVITIDSDWLLAFLAQNVLLSRNLNQYYGLASGPNEGSSADKEERRNPLTRVHYLLHLSHFELYILHCARFARRKSRFENKDGKSEAEKIFLRPPFIDVPQDPSISLSNTLLFILSEYAYREIGVPRELLIYEKLQRQLNFELPLYLTSEFYRDHCYHVMDVCLLGEFLLKCGRPSIGTHNNNIFSQELKTAKKTDLLKNWYVAALCHDLGYVVEEVEKLMGPVEKLKGQGLDQFTESLKKGLEAGKCELNKIIADLFDDVDPTMTEKLKKQVAARIQDLDHGVIGWLYLCQVLKDIGIPLSSMAPALLAVLRHNLADHDGQIHQEPLSLLLLICDHLQEWGRPRVASEQFACGVMENLRFPGREPYFEKKVLMNRIAVKGLNFERFKREELSTGICDKCIGAAFCSQDKTCLGLWPRIQESGLEFQLSYLDAREADFEPVLSWLFFCRDFQCVDYSLRKFLFPVSIRFFHSLSKMLKLLDWRVLEMDIFEEFTHNHEEAAYLCQWIESARNNLEGIKYDVEKKKTNDGEEEVEIGESFTIHLDRLGRPLARGLEDKHWKDFVKWKRRWLAQKYIVRNVGRWYPGID